MSDNKNSLILLGIGLGAILTYIFLKRDVRIPSAELSSLDKNLSYSWEPIDIPRVDDLVKKLSETTQETLDSQSIKIDQPNLNLQPNQTPNAQQVQPISIYKNSEKWEIIRDKDGGIKSINIIRDVKKV